MEPLRTLSASSFGSRSTLLRRSPVGRTGSSSRFDRENTPPVHPNIQLERPSSPLAPKKPLEAAAVAETARSPDPSDPSVKVVVRIRPANRHDRGEERIVRKVSSDSLSVGDRTFTFHSVLGSECTQEDVFNTVGIPLVKNSLAGFNTSIVSYGQTGSGKTYTLWGPPSAMVDGHSINGYQGLVPRIFHALFLEINKKQESSEEEKQTNYQCRCSFLEIYNGRISDLLDPTQRNLQIRDDARNGFHVENLTDEYVTTMEDVTQLLVKGLSNRKVGTTSINPKSSRSHIVFTCVTESWCKGSSSKCFGSSKTSRINLVDLAGADTNKPNDGSSHSVKEGRHVKKSLSKLGKLVHCLAEAEHSCKDLKVPYMDSCLTHLLQETLGGNAKVSFICTVFPNDRHKCGTLSTLRFGERAIHIENKAVINEITEDDVNDLSDQIRQLKEELIQVKSYGASSVVASGGYFKGPNARHSLNLLRASLNRSLILRPIIDNDSDEEVEVDEEDVKELCVQLSSIEPSTEDNFEDTLNNENKEILKNENPYEFTKVEIEKATDSLADEVPRNDSEIHIDDELVSQEVSNTARNHELKDSFCKSSLSISPSQLSHDPTLCESPKISSKLRSIIGSSGYMASDTYVSDSSKCDSICSSLQSSKVSPTVSLAASLHRGLQILDYHQQTSAIKKSFVDLSFEHLASISRHQSPFLCSSCKKADTRDCKLDLETSDMQIVLLDEAGPTEILKKQVDKDDARISEEIKRKIELEVLCAEQEATIKRLSNLVDQFEKSSSVEHNHGTSLLGSNSGSSEMKGPKSQEDTSLAAEYEVNKTSFDVREREALLGEIQILRDQLKSYKDVPMEDSPLEQIRNGGGSAEITEEIEKERERWLESESRWISLTEELRIDLETSRRLAEKKDMELNLEKELTAELDDALHRSILGSARMVEHYAELQEKHESLLWSHKKIMGRIAEVKKAAEKAGGRRAGSAFVSALAAEISTAQIERERERVYLKEQNRGLRIQLRDTAEAVHAAGELLVRLREAEETVFITEEKYGRAQQEVEKLRKQIDKMKKKHAMEMVTMKHYLAESRLPEEALEPFYLNEQVNSEDTASAGRAPVHDDDQLWRSAFTPSYQ